jgi:leucyl aminopeptidase
MTKVYVTSVALERLGVEAIALPFFQGERNLSGPAVEIDRRLKGQLASLLRLGDFKGEPREIGVIYTFGALPAPRLVLVGLGERAKFTPEGARQAAGTLARRMRAWKLKNLGMAVPQVDGLTAVGRAIAEGLLLGYYRFRKYFTKEKDGEDLLKDIALYAAPGDAGAVEEGVRLGQLLARATNYVRDLGNQPGNVMIPETIAAEAQKLSGRNGISVEVLDQKKIADQRMGGLLAVNQGSEKPPRFIVLELNRGRKLDTVVIVGKAITFDSGGISIKPAADMHKMKFDMAGGGAVLGIMQAAAELKLPLHLVGLVPAAENLPSGRAYKPGDILTMHSGRTVEITNTDAEGRLILADALSYAARYQPKAMVDLATLTGAVVVALGTEAVGVLGNDAGLVETMRRAGEASGERAWPLPLWDEYRELLKSDVADLKNAGSRDAGTIQGAIFLKEFVGEAPWVHLDIAGTAWADKDLPYAPKGGTGAGVRLVTQFLIEWLEEQRSAKKGAAGDGKPAAAKGTPPRPAATPAKAGKPKPAAKPKPAKKRR